MIYNKYFVNLSVVLIHELLSTNYYDATKSNDEGIIKPFLQNSFPQSGLLKNRIQ